MSQLFAWGGQSTGVSALASFLPKKYQGWSPCSPRASQESSPTPHFKSINSSMLSLLHSPTLTSTHDYWKTIALTRQTFVGKVMSLLFNMLSRLVITFLPRSKHLLISWLQSASAVITLSENGDTAGARPSSLLNMPFPIAKHLIGPLPSCQSKSRN